MSAPFTAAFLQRYRVERPLGEGGMGMVFRGLHLGLDKAVAIKTLRPEMAPDATAQDRFLSEARLTARLSHPNVVRVLDQGRDGKLLYIVYDFVDGEDLRARLDREKRLGRQEFLRIALGISRAIEHAHAAGIAHRDLKPENVLLGKAGEVQVSDFGLARSLDDTSLRTATGIILGTLHYLSPEAACGKRAQKPADIYALGLMAFEMLAGRRMFEAETAVALLRMHSDEPPRPLRGERPDAPAPLDRLVAQSLEKQPGRRPSASAWVEALQVLEAEPAWTTPASSRQPTIAVRRSDTLPKRAAGVSKVDVPPPQAPVARRQWQPIVAAAALAAISTFVLTRTPPAPPPPRDVQVEPAPAARRTLASSIPLLTGPRTPDMARIRLVMRSYMSVLGDPMAPANSGVDARTQQAEIERLAGELRAAAKWEPVGGLQPLLEEAARLMDEPAEPVEAKLLFLETLQPLLDFEAYMLARGLDQRTACHDFLYGLGKTRRRSFLFQPRSEAELDSLARTSGSTSSWKALENGSMQGASVERPGAHFAIWFLKMLDEERLPRLLPTECAGREDSPGNEACLPSPFQNAAGMHWKPLADSQFELWVRAIDLKPRMTLTVKVAGYVSASFRRHPSSWNDQAPAALVFTMPAPRLDVSPTVVPFELHLQLHPGEDVFARSQPLDQVSLSPVGIVLRLAAR